MTSLLKPILIISIIPFLVTYLMASSRSKPAIYRNLFYLGTFLQLFFVAYAFYLQIPMAFSWAFISQALVVYLLTFNLYLLLIKKQYFEPLYASGINLVFLAFAILLFQPLYLGNYIPSFEHFTFKANLIFKSVTFTLALFQLIILRTNLYVYSQQAKMISLKSLFFWLLTMLTYSLWSYTTWGRYWIWDYYEWQFVVTLLLLLLNVKINYNQNDMKKSYLHLVLLLLIIILIAFPMLIFLYRGHSGYA